MFRRLLAACLAALTICVPLDASAQISRRVVGHYGQALTTIPGDPMSVTITSSIWTSSTDLTPLKSMIDGYTADVKIKGFSIVGASSAYDFGAGAGVTNGNGTSAKFAFNVNRPAWTLSGGVFVADTPVTDTIYGTSWLRQTCCVTDAVTVTESQSAGDAVLATALNDTVNKNDTPSTATFLSGFYTSGSASNAKAGVTVDNSGNNLAYPQGSGVWVTPPGETVEGSTSFTVEFFGGQAYGRNSLPFKGMLFTFCDAGCAHSFTKAATSMTTSVRQPATICTATNGSNVLTGCGDTTRFLIGQRVTVIGIPGQPLVASKTSTSITLASTQQCVTTANSGNITVNGTPPDGNGLADGAFVGAKVSGANITTPADATITSDIVNPTDMTTTSDKTTAVVIHTNATVTTAGTAACTIEHTYQGSTGTVTVTVGQPVPVWSVTAAASDFTGASFADGDAYVRAQAYPQAGDVVLDTQTGVDGTRCDWFYPFVNGGVCNSSSAAWFALAGTDISLNLHNLWFYYDSANAFAPKYAWVSGTLGGSASVSSSPADPGSTHYYDTINAAVTALKTAYGPGANGGVVCLTAAGSPYASMGGNLSGKVVALKPALTVTSASTGNNCTTAAAAGTDVVNVKIGTNGTLANRTPPAGMRFNNVTFDGDANTLQGAEGALNTTFNTTFLVFNDDIFTSSAATSFNKIGVWWTYGGYVDEVTADGRYLYPASSTTGGMALMFATTAICGSYSSTAQRPWWHYNSLGVATFNCAPGDPSILNAGLEITNTNAQPVGAVAAYDKFMGALGAKVGWLNTNNLLLTHDVVEMFGSHVSPALQVSGDSGNSPMSNVWRSFTTNVGGRTNNHYLEGVPVAGTPLAGGGAFPNNTYFTQATYAKVTAAGGPPNCVSGGTVSGCLESATDGPANANAGAGTFAGITVALNGSIQVKIFCDPNYVAYIYVDTAVTGTSQSAHLSHIGQVGGVDQIAIPTCQTVTLTSMNGATRNAISSAGTTAHNELKQNFFQMFNLDNNYNMKGDWFGGSLSQAGSFASGGKVGNWPGRQGARQWGNIAATGTVVGTGGQSYGYKGGMGDFAPLNGSDGSQTTSDLSQVLYKADRSYGSAFTTTPRLPATNIAEGNYCLDATSPKGRATVPANFVSWPWDIQGRTHVTDGTGYSGAYEKGCS